MRNSLAGVISGVKRVVMQSSEGSPSLGREGKEGRERIGKGKGTENAPLRYAPPAGGGYRLTGGPYPDAFGGIRVVQPRENHGTED